MVTATAAQTVLLTGSETPMGRLVLKRLGAAPAIGRILTAGTGQPARGKKVKHLKVPWESEKIIEPVRREKAETIVHLGAFAGRARDDASFEKSVLGTMTLLSAAVEAGVRNVILTSSYLVYGAHYNNPNFLPESRRVRLGGRTQGAKDAAEIERHVQEFLRHYTSLRLAILRLAPVVGPTVDSSFMRYLSQDSCPALLGYDPLVQLLHEEDAADALVAAAESDVSGAVNIAPDGVVPLLKILRFLRKDIVVVPYFPMRLSEQLLAALKTLPFDASYLRFSACLDTDRMAEEMGFRPKRSSTEALRALREGA